MGAASPGPSLGVVVANTVDGGRAAGVATGLGHGLGVGIYAGVAASGVAFLSESPDLFAVIQSLGAVFLCFLGGGLVRKRDAGSTDPAGLDAQKSTTKAFREGFLISFLNPKIAVFFFALFAQLVAQDGDDFSRAAMGLMAGSIDAGWYVLVAVVLSGTGAASWLQARSRMFDVAMGVLLIVLGVGMLVRLLMGYL